ncbi:hypothetical protein HDU91_002076 [Kappamyces sp. JEL0680]|nr:hypothetical protein HDU91_002076 [Kappamyces sp. JEL0680]
MKYAFLTALLPFALAWTPVRRSVPERDRLKAGAATVSPFIHGQKVHHGLKVDSAPSGAKLKYNGGPVIANVEVFVIYWGGKSKVNFSGSQIEGFYTGVTQSSWFASMYQYSTPSTTIGAGSFTGSYDYSSAATGTITDDTIQSTLKSLISSGKIPKPNANTYYAIHFAPGIEITQSDGSASCQVFCAYHGTIAGSTSSGYYQYGIMPDQGGSCAGGCGSSSSTFNNLCSVSSHELAEMVTDPGVGLATGDAPPLGWV